MEALVFIIVVNGYGAKVQILDEAVCISYSINIFDEGINPIILPPTVWTF